MAEAIRDGLRLEAIAADIAGDGDAALELLGVNAYDIAVLDRDIPGPIGDEVAEADRRRRQRHADPHAHRRRPARRQGHRVRARRRRLPHQAVRVSGSWCSGFGRSTAGARTRPPVREIAGLRLDPFRREVYRDGRYVALTRKQFAVLEVLVAAEGGVVSAEDCSSARGTRTRTRSPTPCASRSRGCASASASRRSSPPSPASATGSTRRDVPW